MKLDLDYLRASILSLLCVILIMAAAVALFGCAISPVRDARDPAVLHPSPVTYPTPR